MATKDITAERLRELLEYNPETGIFRWLVSRGNQIKSGSVAGSINAAGYVDIRVDGHRYYGHRLAWFYVNGTWPNKDIDHRHHVTSDNRIDKLRDVPRLINQQNQNTPHRNGTSGFLGVSWAKRDKRWTAQIGMMGKIVHLGSFDTPEAAYAAYLEAKRRLHPGCTI